MEKGRPLSLAKAHVRRDAEASRPNVENIVEEIRAAVIAFVARLDCVAFLKISMIGYWVGVVSAAVTSPILKSIAIEKANASTPLIIMPRTMLRGTTIAAFLTSSPISRYQSRSEILLLDLLHIWHALSTPRTQVSHVTEDRRGLQHT